MLPSDSEYDRPVRPTKPQRFGSVGAKGYGAPVAVVYGRRWVSPTVLMQGSQLEKGYGWFKDSDGSWKNEACIIATALLGLCEGPIAGVRKIFRDGTELPILSNSAAYMNGSGTMGSVAAPAFHSGSQTTITTYPYPEGEPPYFGTACYWSTLWALKGGNWPELKFLVDGFLGDANGTCDPIAVLVDLWSNPRYGLGLDPALLDTTLGVDGNSASGYAAWIASRGWRVARAITDYEGALESIQTLLYETHARMFGSPDGKVKIVPLAPVPALTPQALDQDDFLMGSESTVPVVVERTQQADVYNVVPVEIEYANDTSADNVAVAYEDTSLADAATGSIKRSDPYQAKWIVTPSHATALSFLLAQRSLSVRNRFRFKLGGRWMLLTPGDLVSLTEPVLGLSGKVAMITSTDEAPNGEIQIFSEEWTSQTNPPTGSPAPPEGFGDPGGEPRPDPQPAEAPDLTAVELRLANITSDSRLVNDEKGYLVAQMQRMFGEHASKMAQAASFVPAITTTNYNAAMDALLAYVRAAVPADNAEATGSNGLGLPGTADPPTAQDYNDWFVVPAGVQDGKINISGPTLRTKFGDAITEATLLDLAVMDRNTGRIDNLEDFLGHVGEDGWVSSSEKRGIWQTYDNLRDEHAVLSVAAEAANLTSLAAYNTAIQNLKNYVKAPQPGQGVTPVDGTAQTNPTHGLNMGLSSTGTGTLTDNPTDAEVSEWMGYDTAIHGATFRAKFSAALNSANAIYQEMAHDAWQRIQNYASDGIITRGEKPTIFYEYAALVAERAQIDTQADATTPLASGTLASAVDAEHQAYKQALWNLQNYMNDVLGCPPDAGTGSPSYTTTVPVVANLTTWLAVGTQNGIAGDQAVVPGTFLGYWQAVYVTKAALLRRISEEATNLASSGYASTVTLAGSKAERDMSNITGTAITQAMARNNDLMTAALLSNEIKGDGTNPVAWLSASAIGALAIASDTILARHLLISDFGGAALNKNPSCTDLTAWGAPSAPWPATAANVAVQAVSDGKVGRSALRGTGGVAAAIMSERVPVDPSKRYRLRAWARASVASLAGFRLGLMFFDGSDAPVVAPDGFGTGNYWLTPSGSQTLGTAWTETKGFFGGTGFTRGATEGGAVPATARTMAVAVLFNQGAAAGYHEAQDIRIEEQVSADLMVDGSITGNKIAGGAISAGHLSVFPISQLTTDGSTAPSILTDASVGLPATGRHPSLPCLLVDATRTVAAGPNPKVFEARFRGGTATRGFAFNIQTLAGTSQAIVAVVHDGAFVRVQTNNALDASWSTAVSKATAAPTSDEILTVHWYNSPLQDPDGNTYRCRVYVDGALAASFTTGELGGISPSANLDLVGGFAGVTLGALTGFDTSLRVIDVLLGQAGVVISDGYIGAQHIKAASVSLTHLTFTPIEGGTIVATINASEEGLQIDAALLDITALTVFSSGYSPATDAQQKADDARTQAILAAQREGGLVIRPRVAVDLVGTAPTAPLSTSGINSSASPNGFATRLTASSADPQLFIDVTGLTPGDVYTVAARVRLVSGTWQGVCYYNAASLPYSDARSIVQSAPPVGEWVVVTWDLRGAASFNTATGLTALRLDLGGAAGATVDVDWVAAGKMGAGVAQSEVDAVQAALTALETALDNDDTVTPVEKTALKPMVDALLGEAAGVVAQATSLGMAANDALIVAYSYSTTGAVQVLSAFLTANALWGTVTQDTAMAAGRGATLRTNIQNVLTTKQALLNGIAQRARDNAVTAAGSAADTKIANYNTNTVQPGLNGKTSPADVNTAISQFDTTTVQPRVTGQLAGKETAGAAAGVKAIIEGQYGFASDRTYIDGGRIWTGSVTADRLHVLARNKVNNFSRLPTGQGMLPNNWNLWANDGAVDYYLRVTGYGSPAAPTVGYGSAWMMHLRNTDSQYLVSDAFDIDPGNDYQFNISTFRNVAGSSQYLGILTYDGVNGTGSELGVAYAFGNGTDWARGGSSETVYATNPYWVTGDTGQPGYWHDWKLFIGGANRAIDEVPRSYVSLSTQAGVAYGAANYPVNNWERLKFHPNARSARVRLLNYYNAGTARSIWFLNPQVIDLSAGVIAANRVEANMIRADALQTSNYAEDGNGYPTAGSRLDKSGTSIKTHRNGLRLGRTLVGDAWFSRTIVLCARLYRTNGTPAIYTRNGASTPLWYMGSGQGYASIGMRIGLDTAGAAFQALYPGCVPANVALESVQITDGCFMAQGAVAHLQWTATPVAEAAGQALTSRDFIIHCFNPTNWNVVDPMSQNWDLNITAFFSLNSAAGTAW